MRQKIDGLSVRVCTVLIFMFITGTLFAQRKVSGTVTSAKTNQPVSFASVTVKGTNVATATDVSGAFTISVPAGKNILTITSVGFEDIDVTIGSGPVNVSLKDRVSNLDEIVVTGYVAQKKKEITGSVAVVSVKDLKSVPAGNPEQMLQGQAAGVNVISSGSPGAGSQIYIRGITNFSGTQPLVIIDGVPGDLHNLNANDVESMQVLKDASASIYGAQGANGVVVITTKRGKVGKTTIAYDGYYGQQLVPKGNVWNNLDPQGMADLYWLAAKNSGLAPGGVVTSAQYGTGTKPVLPDYLLIGNQSGVHGSPTAADLAAYNIDYNKGDIFQIVKANKQGTDWFHAVFADRPQQNHNITASGGSEKSTYLFSLNYLDQQGVLLNTYQKRYAARMNTTFNVKNNVRLGENAYIYYLDNPQISNQAEGNEITQTAWLQTIIPLYDINGGFGGGRGNELGNSGSALASRTRAKNNHGYNWIVSGNIWGEVDIAKHFTARSSFGGDFGNSYFWNYSYRSYENKENGSSNGFGEGASYYSNWTWTNSLSYANIFAQKHSVRAFIASEAKSSYGRYVGGNRLNYAFDDPNYHTLSTGSPGGQTNYSGVNGLGRITVYSLIARVDYAFNEKYLLNGDIRRDVSAVLGDSNKVGYFGGVSGAWRISKEGFMKDISWINDLKLRGSWGVLGQTAAVQLANSFNLFGSSPGGSYYGIDGSTGNIALGYNASQNGNPKTKWEGDVITNVGFDAVLFKNHFDLSAEWYKRKVNGLLFVDQAGAVVGGAARPYVNIGDMQNTGVEVSASFHTSVSRDVTFSIGANITTYKNTITSIPGAAGFFTSGGTRLGDVVRNMVGHPVGSFYGYKIIGYYQDAADIAKSPKQVGSDPIPGEFKYADVTPDGVIDDKDRTFIGNPNPKFTYGINLSLTYKQFDFSAIFYGSAGNDIFNYVSYFQDFYASFQNNKSKDVLYNSWTPSNPNAKLPIAENASTFYTNTVVNSFFIRKGSYLRCKQMQIGYNFKPDLLKRASIDRLRIYVQAANLFTITPYKGLDPELAGGPAAFGIDYGNYPPVKMVLVGINLSF